jgi:ribosome-binding factor A
MKNQRQLQIGEKIKRHLGKVFASDTNLILSDGHNITISQVDISPDLKNMRIIIDSFSKIKKGNILKILEQESGYIKNKIAKEINLRSIPSIKFVFHENKDNINNIEQILMEEAKKFNND